MTTDPPRGGSRLARTLGLDGNPLRRGSDRAEAWLRIGLLAVFLIAGPLVALGTGGWAYHAETIAAQAKAAPAAGPPASSPSYLPRDDEAHWQNTGNSAAASEVVTVIMTLTFMALALLAVLRLTLALLTRARLAAWEAAWSRVEPHWSRGTP
jgi:hypothetical protein